MSKQSTENSFSPRIPETSLGRLLLVAFLYLMGVAVASVMLHEAAHFFVALSVGVPMKDIHIGFYGINPSVFLRPGSATAAGASVIGYAGGLTAGIILSAIYVRLWYRKFKKEPSHMYWTFGFVTIVIGCFQVGQGYLEGRFHDAYIYYANSPFSSLSVVAYLFVAFGFLLHFYLFPPARLRKAAPTHLRTS